MSRFTAFGDGRFEGSGMHVRCAVGRSGTIAASEKREGDGASPIGDWTMRRVLFRPDRLSIPETGLPLVPLKPHDGWCDASGHPLYNRPVTLPFEASHEILWRDDHVYDLIVELGYNDEPVVEGRGSAIFLHLARANYEPTEGCVALSQPDLLAVLADCTEGSSLEIKP